MTTTPRLLAAALWAALAGSAAAAAAAAAAAPALDEPPACRDKFVCSICTNCTSEEGAAALLQRSSQRALLSTPEEEEESLAQQEAPRSLIRRHGLGQAPGSEEERAAFLMKATFGPTRESLAAMGSMTYAQWIESQMTLPMTLHRSFYRARVNPRAAISNVSALPRDACGAGSRWLNFAFSRGDEESPVEIRNGVVTVGGAFRTNLDAPNFAKNGLDAASGQALSGLAFQGAVCRVEEAVGGDVEVKSPSCSASSGTVLPNPGLWIQDSSLRRTSTLAFNEGPKAGVILLAAAAEAPCRLLRRPFLRVAGKDYLLDTRLALLNNIVEEPSTGAASEPYFLFSGQHCTPAGMNLREEECQLAGASFGYGDYQGTGWWDDRPKGCIADGSGGLWYNRMWRGAVSAAYQVICKPPCPVVAKTFQNQDGCEIASACGGTRDMVCGSPGESGSDPSKGHRYAFYAADDDGVTEADYKRDPVYRRDWRWGYDRHVIWTMVALRAEDQLRQRVAWALSQVFVTSVRGFGNENHNEMWVTYYDIFVRHAFGSFRDVVKEVTYSPIMAKYLTYLQSQAFDSDGKYPDENYARELMQLFTIGQWMLNMDGTIVTAAQGGEPRALTYDNEDIMNFARVFTGFELQDDRGNYERAGGRNYIDPMRIVPEWHDVYPKPDLFDNFLGDGYPLCADLPTQSFLQQGAVYEFLGFTYAGTDEVEVESSHPLYNALSTVAVSHELDSSLPCGHGLLCELVTVQVVKVGTAYYTYRPPSCVGLFFFQGQAVQRQGSTLGDASGTRCADPARREASVACCDGNGDPAGAAGAERVTLGAAAAACAARSAALCGGGGGSGAELAADVWTSGECGVTVAVDERGRVASQATRSARSNWFMVQWQGARPAPAACPAECRGIRVAATSGAVLAPFAVVDDYVELPEQEVPPPSLGGIEFTMDCSSPATVAFGALIFAPDWRGDSFFLEIGGRQETWHLEYRDFWRWSSTSPVFEVAAGRHVVFLRGREDGVKIRSLQLLRGTAFCRLAEEAPAAPAASCVCPAEVEEHAVFSAMPSPQDLQRRLHLGAYPPEGAVGVQASGGVTAYYWEGLSHMSTVFEYAGRFYKNTESIVRVAGSFSFRNPPAFMTPGAPSEREAHAEVDALIDHLVEHPNAPVHVAYRLIQRLTTSNPSGAYLEAVAQAFATGSYGGKVYSGKRGDLGAAVAATLLHTAQEAAASPASLLGEGGDGSVSATPTDGGAGGAAARRAGGAGEEAPPPRRQALLRRQLGAEQSARSCANSVRNPVEASRRYSSVRGGNAVATGHARSMLHSLQSWSPSSNTGSWMQISLEAEEEVSGVVTQGRSNWQEWVTTFTASVSSNGGSWTAIPGTFNGNFDQDTLVEALFPSPQLARHVRIYPQTWQGRPAIRAGVLVCAAAACGDWDVRLTNVQGSTGTPEIFYQGAFRPLCGYKWYWGETETRHFCQVLGGSGGTYSKTQWVYEADALEARDWHVAYQGGFPAYCQAGNAVAMELQCIGIARTSSCPSPPAPAPAPTVPGELQMEIQSAGCDFPNCGMSAFYLNGQNLLGPNSRGFNVIELTAGGTIVSRSTWDVCCSRDDLRAFVDFVQKLSRGTLLLLSVKDRGPILPSPGSNEFSQYMKAAGEEVMASLGASDFGALDGHMPYALIAKVGYPEDAIESIGIKDDTRLLRLRASLKERELLPPPPPLVLACSNWDVRLQHVVGTRGIPEVYLSGRWRPVCRHYFNDDSASELCKRLGASSGRARNVERSYDEDAVEIRTWGEIWREGLTEHCRAGTFTSLWVECEGVLQNRSTCGEAVAQECSYRPVSDPEDCPCAQGDHSGCDLAECNLGISPGELCEADQPLPDGREDWEVNSCPEDYDVFRYVCGAPTPTPAPTPFPAGGLHLLVKSAAYNAGSRGWSEFYVGGVRLDAPNDNGLNLAVLSASGELLSNGSFTLGDWDQTRKLEEGRRLNRTLRDAADGSIVLASVKDNAWTWREEDAWRDALKALGAEVAVYYRTPYALIAKKGFPDRGVFEAVGNYRDHRELIVEGWFSTTDAPTTAPTPAPVPTPAPTSAPTQPLTPDEEAALLAAQRYGKLREPVVKMMHFLRAMAYEEADADRDVVFASLEGRIGQWMYKSPSVFNFYKPEYSPNGFNGTAVAPEFEIFTPPNAISFYNGMMQLVKTGLNHCDGGLGELQFGCGEDHGRLTYARNGTADEALRELDLLLTAGRLGGSADGQIVRAAFDEAPEGEKLKAAQQAVLFTPEFNTLGETMPQGTREAQPEADDGQEALRPYKAVVKLFFHGGMDSFNMLVPKNCHLLNEYMTVRSDIALDSNTLLDITTTGQGQCNEFGIHPVLGVFKELYDLDEAAFVTNIGGLVEPLTKEQFHRGEGKRCLGLFSHSDQILGAQTLECQSGNGASRGAGGRLGDCLAAHAAKYRTSSFSVSGAAPWSQGFDTHTEILDQGSGAVRLRDYERLQTVIGNITQVRHGQIYSEEYVRQLGSAVEDSEELGKYLESMTLDAVWETQYSLSRQLQQVAKVIKSKDVRRIERDIFFVGIGGFDHHNEVINALAGRFAEINSAVRSFVQELKLMGMFDKVTLITASDFGRTLTSNGAGSDHGWAGQHAIIGGGIRGGKVYNKFPESLLEGNSQDAGRGRLIPLYPWESLELPVAEWMGLDGSCYGYAYPNHGNFNSTHFIPRSSLFRG